MARRKRCKRCDELKHDVIDGYCEECEDFFKEYAGWHHRHLFMNDVCEWVGVGGPDMTDYYLEDFKRSFFYVLDKTGIAEPLATTIKKGKMGFDTIHFSGSIFGYTSVWCWLYSNDSDIGNSFGDKFTDNLTDEENEVMAYGVWWLIGLDGNKTAEANQTTLRWIQEYLKQNQLAVGEVV